VEDLNCLKSQSVTAILSLLSAEDSAHLALREDIQAAKAGMLYRNVPVNDFDDLDLKQKLPVCVDTLSLSYCERVTRYTSTVPLG